MRVSDLKVERETPKYAFVAAFLAVCLCLPVEASTVLRFDSITTLHDGGVPSVNVVFDFDRDGDSDFATANRLSNDVVIFRNDGSRVFTQTQVIPLGAVGVSFKPRSIESADFNGDGWPDLITANQLANSISLFLNDGAGAISAPIHIPVGAEPTDLTITDVNNDGWPDVAVVHRGASSQAVWVFVNNGSNLNVWNGLSFDQSYPIDPEARAVIGADVNLDGFTDLITANRGSATLSLLLGTATAAFMPSTSILVGVKPRELIAVDIDGDGLVDLATVDFDTGDVWAILNNGVVNLQWLGLAVPISLNPNGNGMHGIDSADFDNDGLTDLVMANVLQATGVSVLHNQGALGYGFSVFSTTTCCTSSVTAADLDGDGFTDIITTSAQTNGQVQILWNTIGSYTPPLSADLNSDGVVNSADLASMLSVWGQTGVAADLNSDGAVNSVDLASLLASWGPQ